VRRPGIAVRRPLIVSTSSRNNYQLLRSVHSFLVSQHATHCTLLLAHFAVCGTLSGSRLTGPVLRRHFLAAYLQAAATKMSQ